jgi:zinc-ribbon family
MIIYGTGSTKINEENLFNNCSHCNTPNSLTAFVYTKYFDIFWIPVFPVSKYVSTVCSHCKQVLQEKDMSADLKQTALSLKGVSKTPIKAFSGLMGLGVLFVVIAFVSMQANKKTKTFATKPAIGDIYYIKTDDGNYSSMKLVQMWDDTLSFHYNEYVIGKKSKVNTIDKEKNYDTTLYYDFNKKEIDSWIKSDTVFQIKR